MFRYHWNRLKIELHIETFDKIVEEKVTRYVFTPQDLEKEPTVSVKGKDFLDYVFNLLHLSLVEALCRLFFLLFVRLP